MSDNKNIRVRIIKAKKKTYWYFDFIGEEFEVQVHERLNHTKKPGIFTHEYQVQTGPYAGNAIDIDDATAISDTKKIVFIKPIILFSLMNAEGLFFKSGSFYNIRWTDDINEGKVYSKVGPARSWATKFAKVFPDKAVPQILEITASSGLLVDETQRVTKAVNSIKKIEARWAALSAKHRLEAAKKDLERAKNNLNKVISYELRERNII